MKTSALRQLHQLLAEKLQLLIRVIEVELDQSASVVTGTPERVARYAFKSRLNS